MLAKSIAGMYYLANYDLKLNCAPDDVDQNSLESYAKKKELFLKSENQASFGYFLNRERFFCPGTC